jgi:hypothetical protein
MILSMVFGQSLPAIENLSTILAIANSWAVAERGIGWDQGAAETWRVVFGSSSRTRTDGVPVNSDLSASSFLLEIKGVVRQPPSWRYKLSIESE